MYTGMCEEYRLYTFCDWQKPKSLPKMDSGICLREEEEGLKDDESLVKLKFAVHGYRQDLFSGLILGVYGFKKTSYPCNGVIILYSK